MSIGSVLPVPVLQPPASYEAGLKSIALLQAELAGLKTRLRQASSPEGQAGIQAVINYKQSQIYRLREYLANFGRPVPQSLLDDVAFQKEAQYILNARSEFERRRKELKDAEEAHRRAEEKKREENQNRIDEANRRRQEELRLAREREAAELVRIRKEQEELRIIAERKRAEDLARMREEEAQRKADELARRLAAEQRAREEAELKRIHAAELRKRQQEEAREREHQAQLAREAAAKQAQVQREMQEHIAIQIAIKQGQSQLKKAQDDIAVGKNVTVNAAKVDRVTKRNTLLNQRMEAIHTYAGQEYGRPDATTVPDFMTRDYDTVYTTGQSSSPITSPVLPPSLPPTYDRPGTSPPPSIPGAPPPSRPRPPIKKSRPVTEPGMIASRDIVYWLLSDGTIVQGSSYPRPSNAVRMVSRPEDNRRVQLEIDRRRQSKNINNAVREKNDREREEVNRAAIDFKRATTADARKQVGREIIALGVAKAPRNFMAMNRRKGTDHLKKFVSGNVKSMNKRGHVSGDGVDRAEAVVRDYEAGMMNMEQAKHKVAETLQDNYNAKSHYSQMAENDLVNYNNRLHDERIERMREVRRPRLLPEPVVRRPSRYTNRPEVKSMNMEQLNGYNRAIAMRAARENELQTQEKEQASLAGVFTKTRATMERLVS